LVFFFLGGGGVVTYWRDFDSCTEDLSIYPHRCCLNLGPTVWHTNQ
jgi:hypothetical protein